MRICLVLALLALSFAVFAGGGKERKQNPVQVDEGECAVIVPENLDLEDCTLLTAVDQSGAVMLCDTLVLCPEED